MSKHATQNLDWAKSIQVRSSREVGKFYDIMPMLYDAKALDGAMKALQDLCDDSVEGSKSIFQRTFAGGPVDRIVSLEGNGLIFGATVAFCKNLGLVPVRQPGTLPKEDVVTIYGGEKHDEAILEIQRSLICEGDRVVIVNDLAATGKTLKEVADLLKSLGVEIVSIVTLIELHRLNARELLKDAGYKFLSVLKL